MRSPCSRTPSVLDLHAGLGVLEDVVVLARQHSSRVHEDSALLGSDHTAQSLAREPRATPLTCTHHWVQPLPPATPAAHARQQPASTQPAAAATAQAEQLFYK